MKTYELFLHYKQGEELGVFLEQTGGKVPEALTLWAASFKHHMEVCNNLARLLNDEDVAVFAETHMVSFEPKTEKGRAVLDMLAREEILDMMEFENYDEDLEEFVPFEGCEDCARIDEDGHIGEGEL